MNVVQLNTFDGGGGAARAAYRLHQGIRSLGCDSRLLVQRKRKDDPAVLPAESFLGRHLEWIWPHLDALPVRLSPNRPVSSFSPALVPDRLAQQLSGLAPEIVHLHWVTAGFMQLESLPRLPGRIVWTLHDSWPFTGGCHVPGECVQYRQRCGGCPVLGSSRESDLSRRVWLRKERAWRNRLFTVVTPSRWLAGCAAASSLFAGRPVRVIPNGLDLQSFRPQEKDAARRRFGFAPDRRLILFGGISGAAVINKGFHLLLSALEKLAAAGWCDRAELAVFGSASAERPLELQFPVRFLGHLESDEQLAALYSAADVFVLPSLQENLPNTVMEAMACGTPAVAFAQGGVPELIDHRENGYLAQPFDPANLADGIAWVLEEPERRRMLSVRSRLKAEREFDLGTMARRYLDLYHELLQGGDDGNRP